LERQPKDDCGIANGSGGSASRAKARIHSAVDVEPGNEGLLAVPASQLPRGDDFAIRLNNH